MRCIKLAEINTKYFDRLPFSNEEAIIFEQGPFGFEALKQFLLIRFENENDATLCLQSIDDSDIAFIVINPFKFIPSYEPIPNESDLKGLNVSNKDELGYYAICSMNDDIKKSTANLLCPIAINPENHCAKQLILEGSDYGMRVEFSSFLKEG